MKKYTVIIGENPPLFDKVMAQIGAHGFPVLETADSCNCVIQINTGFGVGTAAGCGSAVRSVINSGDHNNTIMWPNAFLSALAAGEIEGQLMPWEVAPDGFKLATDEERADNEYPSATASMHYWEPVGDYSGMRGWYNSGSDSTVWRKHVCIKAWAVEEDYEFPASIPTKICTTCNDPKPFKDFHRNTANKDGYCGECKACKSKYNKRRYAEKTGKNKSTGEQAVAIAAMMKDLDRLQEEVRLLKGK